MSANNVMTRFERETVERLLTYGRERCGAWFTDDDALGLPRGIERNTRLKALNRAKRRSDWPKELRRHAMYGDTFRVGLPPLEESEGLRP